MSCGSNEKMASSKRTSDRVIIVKRRKEVPEPRTFFELCETQPANSIDCKECVVPYIKKTTQTREFDVYKADNACADPWEDKTRIQQRCIECLKGAFEKLRVECLQEDITLQALRKNRDEMLGLVEPLKLAATTMGSQKQSFLDEVAKFFEDFKETWETRNEEERRKREEFSRRHAERGGKVIPLKFK